VFSPVGIRTPDSFSTAQESVLDWASESDCLQASAGAGTGGDTIGTTAGESNSTTTHTLRIAGLSSIATILIQDEETSIMPPIPMAEVLAGSKGSGAAIRTPQQGRIPAPSVGSAMEGMREQAHSKADPVLAAAEAFTAEAAASTAEEAATVAGATDSSSHEVIKL
jgi:hypothetical protein